MAFGREDYCFKEWNMAVITGGKVNYGRTVKTGDYENKRADAELSFTVDEGEQPVTGIEQASKLAFEAVVRILKLAPAASVAPATAPAPAEAAPVVVQPITKADLEKAAKAPRAAPGKKKANEAINATGRSVEGGQPADPAEVDLGGQANFDAILAIIPDTDLTAACNTKHAEINDRDRIKGLVGKYVDQPKGPVISIPQEKRAAFLAELKTLKKAGV
jgi:hypothetical protein